MPSAPPNPTDPPTLLPSPVDARADAAIAGGVTAVLLVYNQRESACRVVDAVKQQTLPPARIVVVDNTSPDGSADYIAARHPDVEIIRLPQNLGVGAGHNAGWRVALADPACEFVWTLEHDCFPEPTCLAELLQSHAQQAATDPQGLRVMVPRQLHPYLTAERPCFSHHYLHIVRINAPHAYTGSADELRQILYFTLNGILFPTDVMRQAGWLDEDFFFYCEDLDYSDRCRRIGASIYRVGTAGVKHNSYHNHRLFDFGGWIFLSSEAGNITRNYYRFRNSIVLARRRSLRSVLSCLVGYFVFVCFDLCCCPQKKARLRARTMALRDGFMQRLGQVNYAFLRVDLP